MKAVTFIAISFALASALYQLLQHRWQRQWLDRLHQANLPCCSIIEAGAQTASRLGLRWM
jgi:hypothetical protein